MMIYCDHMDIGIRELKMHLSAYLDRAAAGEVIRVTHRGRPKAILGPLPESDLDVERGIEEGWIRAGEETSPRPFLRAKGKQSVRQALDEDRGE